MEMRIYKNGVEYNPRTRRPVHRQRRRRFPAILTTIAVVVVLNIWVGSSDSTHLVAAQTCAVRTSALERAERAREDVLWLARVIYSETKRPEEMELVAWVVRNRVEAGFRGATSYKEVVLARHQFSAFNPRVGGNPNHKRDWYMSRDYGHTNRMWSEALSVAESVYHRRPEANPLPGVLHFYSPRSMKPAGRIPAWAQGKSPAPVPDYIDPDRFRFYAGVK